MLPYLPRLYFAYGSNLNLDQMQVRCKFARPVGTAILKDYQLVFKGVADVVPDEGSEVYGGLWEITPNDLGALDRYEGYPNLYDKHTVKVVRLDKRGRPTGMVEAMTYMMTGPYARDFDYPPAYYLRTIAVGYNDFKLPYKALRLAFDRTAEAVEGTTEGWEFGNMGALP